MTQAVHELAGAVWDARWRKDLKRDCRDLARALAVAVAADVRESDIYDPETDVRVRWMRGVIEDLRRGPVWRTPRASVDLEFAVLTLLGRLEAKECGKVRACGG